MNSNFDWPMELTFFKDAHISWKLVVVLFSVGQFVLAYGSYLVVPGAAAVLGMFVYFAFYVMGSYHCVAVLGFFPPLSVFLRWTAFWSSSNEKFYCQSSGEPSFRFHWLSFLPFSFSCNSFESVNCLAQSWKFDSDEVHILFNKNNSAPGSQAFNPYLQSCCLLLFRRSLSCSFSLYSVLMWSHVHAGISSFLWAYEWLSLNKNVIIYNFAVLIHCKVQSVE